MLGTRKNTLPAKVFIAFVFFAFVNTGFAAQIVPTGTVSIIEDGKVIGKFSQDAPLPEGALLKCESNCAVKLDDVHMTVEPKTVFSVIPMANRHILLVQQGTVHYSLNESSRPLHFITPAVNAETGRLLIEGELIRSYVRVVGNDTEIGVLSGGSMMIQIGSGEIGVLSGNKITITLIDSEKISPVAIAQEGLSLNKKYTIGTIDDVENLDSGESRGRESGGGNPAGGNPGSGDPGGGDPGGGDPGGGDDGDKGGGKGGDKGGGKGGDKGGGKGGDKGGGKGGSKK